MGFIMRVRMCMHMTLSMRMWMLMDMIIAVAVRVRVVMFIMNMILCKMSRNNIPPPRFNGTCKPVKIDANECEKEEVPWEKKSRANTQREKKNCFN